MPGVMPSGVYTLCHLISHSERGWAGIITLIFGDEETEVDEV